MQSILCVHLGTDSVEVPLHGAVMGMYAAQLLLVKVLGRYLMVTLALNTVLLGVTVADYTQHKETILLYLFVPGIVIDLVLGSLSVSLYRKLSWCALPSTI